MGYLSSRETPCHQYGLWGVPATFLNHFKHCSYK